MTAMDDAQPQDEELQARTMPQFLKLQKNGLGRQARSFRLKQGDVLVAVDGDMFSGDATQLLAVFSDEDHVDESSEEDEDNEGASHFLLTFWREGTFFNLMFDQPLVARYDFSSADESLKIVDEFQSLHFEPKEAYLNFEVFKDIYRNASLHQLKEDPLASIAPLLWMLNHRLFLSHDWCHPDILNHVTGPLASLYCCLHFGMRVHKAGSVQLDSIVPTV